MTSSPRRQHVMIAGATGLIGTALTASLRAAGHRVSRLVRSAASSSDEVVWQPARGELDPRALAGVDAVVNLAGENVGAGRWTRRKRDQILDSRIDSTRTLVDAIARSPTRPAVLINASAVGFYGERGDDVVTEESPSGAGFLAEVCRAWESEAHGAEAHGVRVVVPRFGVVLAREGGALARLIPLFRRGLGGRIGDGRQWMAWGTLDDVVRSLIHLLFQADSRGAYNVTAPTPVMNAEFTQALAAALRKPALIAVPRLAVKLAFGQMAESTILASTRAMPARLTAEGFRWNSPSVASALSGLLGPAAAATNAP